VNQPDLFPAELQAAQDHVDEIDAEDFCPLLDDDELRGDVPPEPWDVTYAREVCVKRWGPI
jgi:hypothetical protein